MSQRTIELLLKAKDETSPALRSVHSGLNEIKDALGAIGIGLSVGALVRLAKDAIDAGSAINDLSVKSGIGARDLSTLKYAADQCGSSIESVATAAKFMQRNLAEAAADGASPAAQAIKNLNLSISEFMSMSPDEVFRRIVKSIGAIENPSIRTQYALQLMGRSGDEMMKLAESLDELESRAKSLGLVMTDDMARALDDAGDALEDVRLKNEQLRNEMTTGLAPAITKASDLWIGLVRNLEAYIATAGRANLGVILPVPARSGDAAGFFGEPLPNMPGATWNWWQNTNTAPPPLGGKPQKPPAATVWSGDNWYDPVRNADVSGQIADALEKARENADWHRQFAEDMAAAAEGADNLASELERAKAAAVDTVISNTLGLMQQLAGANAQWVAQLQAIYRMYQMIAAIIAAIKVLSIAAGGGVPTTSTGSFIGPPVPMGEVGGASKAIAGAAAVGKIGMYGGSMGGAGGVVVNSNLIVARPVRRSDFMDLGRASYEAAREAEKLFR